MKVAIMQRGSLIKNKDWWSNQRGKTKKKETIGVPANGFNNNRKRKKRQQHSKNYEISKEKR